MTVTKLPPAPPTSERLAPKPSVVTSFKQIGHYELPMASRFVPAWRAVLSAAGYPTDVVVLDFETYFDSEYRLAGKGDGLSTIEYVTDRRFEVIGVGVLEVPGEYPFTNYQTATRWYEGEVNAASLIRYLKDKYGSRLERCTLVAHNAIFEGTVLWKHYDIQPEYIVDTLGLARHWHSRHANDLGAICKRLGIPHKGDTSQFKGMSFKLRYDKPKESRKKRVKGQPPPMPTPRPQPTDEQRAAMSDYCRNDVMREWEVFTVMLPRLSNPCTELRVMQHTLDLFLKPKLCVDYAKAESLKAQMEEEIDRACAAAGLTREEVSSNKNFESKMADAISAAGEDPLLYMKQCKRGLMLATAKNDEEREVLLNHPNDSVRKLMSARVAIKSWPLHIARIDRIVNQARANGGVLPVPLNYCGAHTGRWSGGEKINLQNLGSRGHELVNAIRELIIAPPGHVLVIADASQIEARVLAWLARQNDLVQQFAEGADIYCEFASEVLGRPVRKPRKDGIPAVEARHKWARNMIGKPGILGCGYGMGKHKLNAQYNLNDLDLAEKIVTAYRTKYAHIKQFWSDIERAFIYTFKYGEPCELNGLRFDKTHDADVVITLHSGRELKYHDVRVIPGRHGDELEIYNHIQRSWDRTWGGSLTENVVQAISRDILWEAIWKMEMDGRPVRLHVHDELVAVVPEEDGEQALRLAIRYLSERPEWGPDLPLAAEGVISSGYGEH